MYDDSIFMYIGVRGSDEKDSWLHDLSRIRSVDLTQFAKRERDDVMPEIRRGGI